MRHTAQFGGLVTFALRKLSVDAVLHHVGLLAVLVVVLDVLLGLRRQNLLNQILRRRVVHVRAGMALHEVFQFMITSYI